MKSGGGFRRARVARERGHTLLFLDEIRAIKPVFLDTDIDMTAVQAYRSAERAGLRYSVVSHVLHVASRVLAVHPDANAAMRGHLWPQVAWYDSVNGKVTLDKNLNGHRVVVSTVLNDVHRMSIDEIQERVEHFREGDPATMPEFAPMRTLQRLPRPLSRLAFRLGVRPLAGRARTMGTFAVTSLGHRPVDGFYSVGGTTITLGIGRIADRPAVRDGRVAVVPLMRLSLTFDHRVIDGAEAADVLAEIKDGLENWKEGRV
ncbi:2-oxo acid dehydrogenase subunit E2 [Streptomyces sp. NPDC048516]|uniref:2-oxo acid dehydrogenase subunit E2 n=1 Tax=Streptomyces sp. NPDC048516 TaxID=3365565 RepID=UPI00371CF840